MSGLIPTFTMADLNRQIGSFVKSKERDMFEILSYIGIECVNYAKRHHTYRDQSGNLTSSIGYAIIYDGKIEKEHFGGKTAQVQVMGSKGIRNKRVKQTGAGKDEGGKIIRELAERYPEGMILVVVAGMEYAAAVESKKKDVITQSSKKAEELMSYMRERLGIAFT